MKKEKQKNHPEMPYERFLSHGKDALSNAELLAVLLRSGTAKEPVLQLAKRLLSQKNGDGTSLSALYDFSLEELTELPGIGTVKAIQIQCLLELSRRLAMEAVRGSGQSFICRSAAQVADCYMESLRHEKQEKVLLLLLNSKNVLIREEVVTIGTVNTALCSPRDIFMRALQAGASNILVMHNHPSGDPLPSEEDIRLTRRLAEIGNLMEIHLLDHVIVGDRCFFSMQEAGLLRPAAGECDVFISKKTPGTRRCT